MRPIGARGRLALWVLALVLAWAPDAVLGQRVYFTHDLRHHHVPWRVWAAGEWAAGRLPMWAPEVANGFPLAADGQTGAWYPPGMLLFALLPPADAVNALMLLHLALAAVGAGWLALRHGASVEAGLLAAVGYGFSGFLVSHAHYLGFQNAAAWLPWLLLAVHSGRTSWMAVVAWLMLVAGHPQAAAMGLLLGLAVAATARHVGRYLGASALAAVAAGPQLVSTLELVRFSLRDGGLSAAAANTGSLWPPELVGAVLPTLFGFERPADITETYHHKTGLYWGPGENYWEMCFYLGVPLVALAIAGARGRRFWVGLVGVSALLMLGGFGPLWPIVRHLPGLDGFRFPARFALWLTLAVALLGAFGLDRLTQAPAAQLRRVAARVAGVAVVFFLGATAARGALDLGGDAIQGALTAAFERRASMPLPPPPPDLSPLELAAMPVIEPDPPGEAARKAERVLASLISSTEPSSAAVLRPTLALLGLALALAARGAGRLSAGAAGAAAVAVLYADLLGFGGDFQARVPRSLVEARPRALEVLGAGRATVLDRRQSPDLDMELLSANLGLLYDVPDVLMPSPLRVVRHEALLSKVGLDIGDKGAVKVERLLSRLDLVDLLGVRWLLTVHPIHHGRLELVQSGLVKVYENKGALSRAFLVGCVALPPEGADATTWAWEALDALDPRALALVEPTTPEERAALAPLAGCADGAGAGRAWIVEESPTHTRVRVEAQAPALLVQSDTWYPGWTARLDGEPVTLHLADFVFRGVMVPAGVHEVELRYQPRPLALSLLLAPLALIAMAGLAAAERARAARTGDRPESSNSN